MEVLAIEVTAIVRDPHNREPGDVTHLAKSIAKYGLQQPIVVTRTDDPTFPYQLVAGERRLEAVRSLGMERIDASILNGAHEAEDYRAAVSLVENVHRTPLTVMEEARAYARLFELGVSKRDIGIAAGVNQKTVSARINLTDLPVPIQDLADKGAVDLEQLNVLSEVAHDGPLMAAVVDKMERDDAKWGLNVTNLMHHAKRQLVTDAALAELEPTLAKLRERGATVYDKVSDVEGRPVAVVADNRRRRGWTGASINVDQLAYEDHKGEPCAAFVLTYLYEGDVELVQLCRKPVSHRAGGASEVKIKDAETEQTERTQRTDQVKATKARRAIEQRAVALAMAARRPNAKTLLTLVAAGRANSSNAKALAFKAAGHKVTSDHKDMYDWAEKELSPVDHAIYDALVHVLGDYTWSLEKEEVDTVKEWLAPYMSQAQAEADKEKE